MNQSSAPADADRSIVPAPRVIAGRYDVLAELGHGGMGRVYRVSDRNSGEQRAVKLLHRRGDPESQADLTLLFEREFHSLAQLAHPCIISVQDYGVDDGQPYYTMELLSGTSLRESERPSWQQACRLLRDVASALALLHSRRYIHRDVTPRNIHCVANGRAKLIDFGLMAPAGPQKAVMGTPPFVAPEAVHLQPLDGRADLYGLGATAYWVLAGRHAYPARRLSGLRDAFRTTPLAPSMIDREIPEALSRLVLSLLSLDPNGRPSSAAEVIEQLNGIAGLQNDEALAVSAAYLATPKLVGRRSSLLQVRRQLVRTLRGAGSLLMVDGQAGVGRSRFLDACVLEGKLLGFAVLRADATDGVSAYGVVKALGRQLVELRAEDAVVAAGASFDLIAGSIPALRQAGAPKAGAEADPWADERSERPSVEPPARASSIARDQERSLLQEALRQWFLAFSRVRPLLIAVDDVDQIDEPSAAMLAGLGDVGFGHKLILALSGACDRAPRAPAPYQVLAGSGQRIRLRELDAPDSLELLSSVFGRVPNVELLADRLHKAASGNPRALVELAEHLVARRAVRYDAGAWSLPRQIDAGKLPDSLEQVRAARIAELSADARSLAETFSLSSEHGFSLEEIEMLAEGIRASRLHQALSLLLSAGILSLTDTGYSFVHRGYVDVLAADIDPERRLAAHRKLARLLHARAAPAHQVAWHFQAGGEDIRAIETLSTWLEPNLRDPNRAPHVGADLNRVLEQLEHALCVSERLRRPPRERYVLRSALVAFGSYEPAVFHRHSRKLFEELSELSGLTAYHALDAALEPKQRLSQALTAVQARYDALPEVERVLAPIDAIRQLARWIAALARVVGGTYERALLELVPSIEPLAPMSPQLQIVAESCAAVQDLIDGNFLRACERWRVRIEANPSVMSVCYALGLTEASVGIHTALERAAQCEADPGFRIQAWRIRMTYHLVQGDWVQAEKCRKTEERLRIQHGGVQDLEGSHLNSFLIAYARADDLMGVKQTMDATAAMAKRFEGWVPILGRAKAEYHRLRGDCAQALVEYEGALSRMAPARHAAWYTSIEGQVGVLVELGRAQEARFVALRAIEVCEQLESMLAKHAISRALSLVEARLGDFPRAVARIEAVIAAYQQLGVTGILLAGAHESRARIAIAMDDRAAFEHFAARVAEVYDRGRSAALKAKYARLMDDARQQAVEQASVVQDIRATMRTTMTRTETVANSMHTALARCRGSSERADELLKLVLKQMRLERGALYTVQQNGITLSAARAELPAGLDEVVERFLSEQLRSSDEQTEAVAGSATGEQSATALLFRHGDVVYRPLLLSSYREDRDWVTGVLVVCQLPDTTVLVPHDTLQAASDALIEAGDVVGDGL